MALKGRPELPARGTGARARAAPHHQKPKKRAAIKGARARPTEIKINPLHSLVHQPYVISACLIVNKLLNARRLSNHICFLRFLQFKVTDTLARYTCIFNFLRVPPIRNDNLLYLARYASAFIAHCAC